MPRLVPCALCLLAACTQFPELDAVMSDDVATADYPALAPLDPLLTRGAEAADAGDIADAPARAEGLRARGEALGEGETTDAEARAALADRADALRARSAARDSGLGSGADRDPLSERSALAERRDALAAAPPPDAAALDARRRALQEAADVLRAQ